MIDKQALNERASTVFPYALGAIVPLAGLVLAAAWIVNEGRRYDAAVLVAASLLGALIWVLVLTS